jgi:N-acetylglutamate synthase-like GNAT family acetyltransferase
MALREVGRPPKVLAHPLSEDERGPLARILAKAGLASDDLTEPHNLFWRFQDPDQVPLGFGGLELHGKDALLRSVLTLPPARQRGIGRAIVAALEVEAMAAGCRDLWLLTSASAPFFEKLGYQECERRNAPVAIQASRQFSSLCPASATLQTKRLR